MRRLTLLMALAACGPSNGDSGGGGGDDAAPGQGDSCTDGRKACDGNDRLVCRDGVFEIDEVCDGACDEGLGCVQCVPGTGTCDADRATVCASDGSGFVDFDCDPLMGLSCDVDTGLCDGECAPHRLGRSYIGCEYFPTVTGNQVPNHFAFAIAVSNTTAEPADVHIDGPNLDAPIVFTVVPDEVVEQELPWVPALKTCTSSPNECGRQVEETAESVRLPNAAYHLRSTRPVTVYQFNPLQYTRVDGGCGLPWFGHCSHTNDASLLFPANALRGEYVVASWPQWDFMPGLFAITATEDDTSITIVPTENARAGFGVPGLLAGNAWTTSLNEGGVIQLLTERDRDDFTGSIVTADKPVQVIGGHVCTFIPDDVSACDHLEESVFPVEVLGDRYFVGAPRVPTMPQGKPFLVRIIATEDHTHLTYDPPQPGRDDEIELAGEFIELDNVSGAFEVTADRKILVAQFMLGESAGGEMGDPAMTQAVPVDQFRVDYQFHAPPNYPQNFVDIVAPDGAAITLDGAAAPLEGFAPIGASGYGWLQVQLDEGKSGTHTLRGDAPFGITVYGYGDFTSYWYPGGLDLDQVIVD